MKVRCRRQDDRLPDVMAPRRSYFLGNPDDLPLVIQPDLGRF
jgi:hypothetical protein